MRIAAKLRAPRIRLLRQAGGWLAVAAMVLLASPGVQVVRAESPAAAPARSIPLDRGDAMCRADGGVGQATRSGAVVARIAERLQVMAAEDEDTVVLNGRGLNYPSGRVPWQEIERIEAETSTSR
jgi:hypothetical protein